MATKINQSHNLPEALRTNGLNRKLRSRLKCWSVLLHFALARGRTGAGAFSNASRMWEAICFMGILCVFTTGPRPYLFWGRSEMGWATFRKDPGGVFNFGRSAFGWATSRTNLDDIYVFYVFHGGFMLFHGGSPPLFFVWGGLSWVGYRPPNVDRFMRVSFVSLRPSSLSRVT